MSRNLTEIQQHIKVSSHLDSDQIAPIGAARSGSSLFVEEGNLYHFSRRQSEQTAFFVILFSYYINSGHLKTLNQFTYNDRDINDIILSCMSNVSMTGITGNIAFGEGSDPIKNVKIERIQGNFCSDSLAYLTRSPVS